MAAISHMYANAVCINLLENYHIKLLVEALIKSGTKVPMVRSKVMPIQPFRDLFTQWPDNNLLSIKDLRVKTITLIPLVIMLRPSDLLQDHSISTVRQVQTTFLPQIIQFCEGEALQKFIQWSKLISHGNQPVLHGRVWQHF